MAEQQKQLRKQLLDESIAATVGLTHLNILPDPLQLQPGILIRYYPAA